MKKYRLLRNNKESGPYSAEELIQLGFKPYDLIWADSKSAAWRYPGELEEFKPYAPVVEEQPYDRFYKKPSTNESKPDNESKKETPVIATASNINTIPSVAVKQEKPRIRIKADSRKIEIPVASKPVVQKESTIPVVQKEIAKSVVQKEMAKPVVQEEKVKPAIQKDTIISERAATNNPDWKNIWLDWEQEKKAVNAVQNISLKEQHHEALETKFAQSLDEIKERYAETVLKPRRNNNSSVSKYSNYITAFVLIIAILGLGMWMGTKWSKKSNTNIEQKVPNVQHRPDQIVAENEQANEQTLPADNKNETADESINVRNTNSHEKLVTRINKIPVTKKSQVFDNTNKLAATKSSFQKQQKKPVKDFIAQIKPDDIGLNKNQEETKPAVPASKNQDRSPALTHFKTEPKITDYIAVDTYTPSPASAVGVKLRVQNISDIPVDMVMVDLQYYDTNGRYQTGATVYVRNINAGQTVTIPAPDNNLAVKVNYRISMVSSERNNMYLIAD